MVGPDLGNAIPHETISLEPISTGLSFASSDASARGTGVVVVVIFFMIFPPLAPGKARKPRALPATKWGLYALTSPFVLWTMISPSVTFGGFWRISSSFWSRTHSDARRVDSLA
jgi:hypothetical protein